MDRIYSRCAGLDVHKDTVWACVRADGRVVLLERFGTTTRELLRLGDRLAEHGVTIVAMESTGVYWKPVWNLLEDRFQLLLANAQHMKNVPGRKTDVKDCQWVAELLEHGLLKASFVPPRPQRELRDLTRQRTQVLADRARVVNRVQKTLEDANIKLAGVATDITGKSGRAILDALVAGELTPAQMAELVHRRMEAKKPALREALAGRVTPHHRFMLGQLLAQIDHLDGMVEQFDARVEAVMSPLEKGAVERLDDIPGIDTRSGQILVAEVGTEAARQFPSAHHLASWAGVCPGNHESAGKRRGGRTRPGNGWLKAALMQAGWAAARTRRSYYSAQHRRLAGRRGAKRATMAVAHSLLVTAYCVLSRGSQYVDLGADHLEKRRTPQEQAQQMVKKLQKLGYAVEIRPAA